MVGLYCLLAIPVFNSGLNDDVDYKLRKSMLTNKRFMLKMPDTIKKFLFVMLASSVDAKAEELLEHLIPEMQSVD